MESRFVMVRTIVSTTGLFNRPLSPNPAQQTERRRLNAVSRQSRGLRQSTPTLGLG